MFDTVSNQTTEHYARCIEVSKKVRWDIQEDVIQGRTFDITQKFLPDGLSLVHELDCLSPDEQRFLSQIQGRTYANIFGLVERFINAKILEISKDHWLGDQIALEALIRFSDEELKHQALFRRIEELAGADMPDGYIFVPDPNEVADAVLKASTWAVLGLTLHIELFTQLHFRESIAPDDDLSPLYKDVFLYHWKEECQHAVMDELEWVRHDAMLSTVERDQAVDDFIGLVGAVDGILQAQAAEDVKYFTANCGRPISRDDMENLDAGMLKAYRWQYILSGTEHPHFLKVMTGLVNGTQAERIGAALASLV